MLRNITSTILLLITLTFCNSASGFAQNSKYNFEKGLVLKYEYKVKEFSSRNNQYAYYYQINLEFEVIEVLDNSYRMRLTLGKYKEYSKMETEEFWRNRYGSKSLSNMSYFYPYYDEDQQIEFNLITNGDVLNMSGIEDIKAQAYEKLKMQRPDYRMVVNKDYMEERYSDDYYRLLILDVFPKFSEDQQVNKYFSGNNTTEVSLIFNITDYESVNHIYTLEGPMAIADSINKDLLDAEFSIKWNPKNGSVIAMSKRGIHWLDYCWYNFTNRRGNTDWDFRQVLAYQEIKLTGSYKRAISQGVIIGNVLNSKDKTIHFISTPHEIQHNYHSERIYTESYEKEWKIDLSDGPNFANYYFEYPDSRFTIYAKRFTQKEQLQFYLRPGDTIRFFVDLNDFENFKIESNLLEENLYLNKFNDKEGMVFSINEGLKAAERNYRVIKNVPDHFDVSFIEHAKLEHLYYMLAVRLGQYAAPMFLDRPPYQELPGVRDSLNKYHTYLDNPKVIHSNAYRLFLDSYFYSLERVNREGEIPSAYELAAAYFKNWDRYYILSGLAYSATRSYSSGRSFQNSQNNYNKFIFEYGDTKRGKQLKEEYSEVSKYYCDKTLPEVIQSKIKEANSGSLPEGFLIIKNMISSNMIGRDHHQEFHSSTLPGSTFIANLKDIGTVIVIMDADTLLSHQDEIDKRLNDADNLLVIGVDEGFKNSTKGLSHGGPMVVDPGLKIVGYEAVYSQINLENLKSWPVEEDKVEKSRNLLPLIYILLGLLLSSLLIFLIINIRVRRRNARTSLNKKLTELELEAVRSRMNPHFMFNALGSIQNLVNTGKIDEANSYLASFGALIRDLLDHSSESIISLKEEIALLESYLDMEKLCMPFQYDLVVDPAINQEQVELPPLFIQPHVENAIIHGIKSLGGEGKIVIEFKKEGDNLIVLVSDNGPGFEQGAHVSSGLGKGWKMTRQRISLLKKQWGDSISAEIMPNAENCGTLVKFVIPIERKAA